MKKLKEFILVGTLDNLRLIPVEADPNPLNDDTFICKYEDRREKWRVVDRATGLMITCGKTKKEAIQRFIDRGDKYLSYKKTNPHYQRQIARFNELREKEVDRWRALVN